MQNDTCGYPYFHTCIIYTEEPNLDIHIVRLIILIVLVMLSSFFSSAETALMTCNKVRMKALSDEGNAGAALVLKICEDTQRMLTAILIGNNIVNLSASALMTVFVTDLFGSLAIGIGTGVLTLIVLIFGEIGRASCRERV